MHVFIIDLRKILGRESVHASRMRRGRDSYAVAAAVCIVCVGHSRSVRAGSSDRCSPFCMAAFLLIILDYSADFLCASSLGDAHPLSLFIAVDGVVQ
jgi:hypothetical protein